MTGCLCGNCGKGLTNTPGGKCVRCKVGDMSPGLAKSVATALLPIFNSDLPEAQDGVVWAASRTVRSSAVDASKRSADIEAA